MERQTNIDNIEYFIDRIFDRYENEIEQAIENFESNETYIEQTHFGDFLLFKTNYIRLYAIHEENGTGYEMEYKFEPFGTWQSIVQF